MDKRIVTLAIHTSPKALILKQVLEDGGVEVCLEEIPHDGDSKDSQLRMAVKIEGTQISKALTIIEKHKLFSYNDLQTYQVDDGRKRILVAVDFSSYSMKACQIAFSIAKEINAKVKILHVYNNLCFPTTLPFANLLKDEGEVDILDRSRKHMLNLCMEIEDKISEKEFPSVNYSYSLREGLVDEEIEAFIREYKPILLVLGTKGKSNSRNSYLGGVAADIIEMTDIPVMAVPEKSTIQDVRDIKHIAFFTNLHQRDLMSFDYLVTSIPPSEGLKVTLVHINVTNKNKIKLAEDQLAGLKEVFTKKYPTLDVSYKLIEGEDVIPAIKKFIDNEKVNLISVNTRRRNILGRIFIPSASRKILSSIDVTMLALRGESLMKLKHG